MDDKKQRLWSLVTDNQEELFGICGDLIKIPSVTPEQVESIVAYVCAFLADASIEYDVIRGPENTPSIIASVGKKGGKFGIFNGHTDVVPVGELKRWDYSPYCGQITDTQILGRGASDMKCGVGIMLFIARKIKQLNLALEGELRLHIVHDEESGGQKGSYFLINEGYADGAEFVMIPEPTTCNNVEVGQKGSMQANITTYGMPYNSSVINYVGENADHKMVSLLNGLNKLSEMKTEFPSHEQQLLADSKEVVRRCIGVDGACAAIDHVNITINSVDGGTSRTMTPEICHSQIGLLVPAYISTEAVKKEIDKIIAQTCPKGGVDIHYTRSFDGAAASVDTPLVKAALKYANDFGGEKVVATHQWATSDAKYYRYKGIPTIQYGPANVAGIHAYNECAEKAEIVQVAKVYLAVLDDLIGFAQ